MINPVLHSLIAGIPAGIASQCSALPAGQQQALANLLRYEVDGARDGFALRERSEADLYQFDYTLNQLASTLLSLQCPPLRQAATSPIFGALDDLGDEVRTLQQNGYLVSSRRVSGDALTRIHAALADLPFQAKGSPDTLSGAQLLALAKSGHRCDSGTFWLREQNDAVHDPFLLSLAFDPYILSMAINYLCCTPIHVQTNAWFSFAGSGVRQQLSASAQLYHQDKEFTKFLKVFVYLDDVGPENGPHSYVEGSHIDELFIRGVPFSTRLTDQQVLQYFAAERLRTVTGPAGTVIFGDTSAVHKGWPVISGHRVILQFEYATSLYLSPIMPFTNAPMRPGVSPRMLANHDSDARERFRTMMEGRKTSLAGRVLKRIRRRAAALSASQ